MIGAHKGQENDLLLNKVSNKVIAYPNVLRARMLDRIMGNVDWTRIITRNSHRAL